MESSLIHIQSFNKKGWGVGPSDKGAIEVFGALPAEEVQVGLGRWRRGKCRGELEEVIKPSESRVAPRCGHVAQCGGCVWQQMEYGAQLRVKEERLRALFGEGVLRPIIACEDPW